MKVNRIEIYMKTRMKVNRGKRLARLVRKLVEGKVGHRVILLSMEFLFSRVWRKYGAIQGYKVCYIDTRTLFEEEIFFPYDGKEYALIKNINCFYSIYWMREKRIFVRTKRMCGYAYNSQALPNGYCVKRSVRV